MACPKTAYTWNSITRQVLASNFGVSELLCIRAGDTFDKPPFDGSTGGTLRAHPGLTLRSDTLEILCTDADAVCHTPA